MGLLRGHAALDVFLGLPLNEVTNILVEVFHHALAPAHGSPSCTAGLRIRAMAPASLSHLLVSTAS